MVVLRTTSCSSVREQVLSLFTSVALFALPAGGKKKKKETCKYPTNGAAAKKPAGYEATVFVGAARARWKCSQQGRIHCLTGWSFYIVLPPSIRRSKIRIFNQRTQRSIKDSSSLSDTDIFLSTHLHGCLVIDLMRISLQMIIGRSCLEVGNNLYAVLERNERTKRVEDKCKL